MFILDDKSYNTIEEASKASGIAKSTLESHINTTWKSRKGAEHTLIQVEEQVSEEIPEPVEQAPENDPVPEPVFPTIRVVDPFFASNLLPIDVVAHKFNITIGDIEKACNTTHTISKCRGHRFFWR